MNTGVIGLGAMGAPMARNLAKAGLLHALCNRTAERAQALAQETGAHACRDAAELAAECELIVLSVSADADVMQVINQLVGTIRPHTIVVDTSTVNAATAREAAALLAKNSARFLDAPVSGGVEGAKQGTLAMMVGGDTEVLAQAKPVLQAIAGTIVHMGPVGAGQATKAVNQIMAAGINQAVTEALAFGEAMDLPMDKVVEVVGSGAAGNWFLSHRGPSMLAGDFPPGFKLALHHKDLAICKAMAAEFGVALPIIEMTLIHYRRLIEQGYGDEDISALFRLKRGMFERK